jgi:cytochrome c-type biogenesis protein CcmH
MLMFWLVAALLLVGGLLLIVPALWTPRSPMQGHAGGANVAVYRDQLREAERDLAADLITPDRYEQLRGEIQRRVLEDTQASEAPPAAVRPSRRVALGLVLLIPAASILTYLAVGRPDATAPMMVQLPPPSSDGQHQVTGAQIESMITALAARLQAEPNNPEGWLMLGRSYIALSRHGDAVAALRKAQQLMPGNPDVLADLADAVGVVQDRRLAGEPAQLVQLALKADPRHAKALALAGSVAFEAKDFAGARAYWERLQAVIPPDSEMARSVRDSIAEATQLAGGGALPGPAVGAQPGTPSAAPSPPTAVAAAGNAVQLTGEVAISPEMAARVAQGDTLFVFARAAQGPRIPLAILRQPVGTWPVRFTLTDSMSMAPGMTLSAFAQVSVGARVSRSGNAMPQPGDLIANAQSVANTAQGVKLVIDQAQP